MKIVLYRVGRNLNRVYRTAEAFGVDTIQLLDCDAVLSGMLFKAKNRVNLERIDTWPSPKGLLALETFYTTPLWEVKWERVNAILIGGERRGLPRGIRAEQKAVIPMYGEISGLTVEAAVAIALWEWRRLS